MRNFRPLMKLLFPDALAPNMAVALRHSSSEMWSLLFLLLPGTNSTVRVSLIDLKLVNEKLVIMACRLPDCRM